MSPGSPANEPPLLLAFADRVRRDNPMHRAFLDSALANLTPEEGKELGEYIGFCISRGLAVEYLARSYLMVVTDTLREQIYFRRHGRYRYSTSRKSQAMCTSTPSTWRTTCMGSR